MLCELTFYTALALFVWIAGFFTLAIYDSQSQVLGFSGPCLSDKKINRYFQERLAVIFWRRQMARSYINLHRRQNQLRHL